MPRVSLIHATPVAIAPVVETFENEWPDATICNLLEDSLSADLSAAGNLDDKMVARFETLGRYAVETGADAILFTCSAFGAAIEIVAASQAPLPVLKPNEAMFEEALATGARIGMVATFEPSVASMTREFEDMAKRLNSSAAIEVICVPEAMAALGAGDADTHNRLVARAAAEFSDLDVLMLAQFSTAQARGAVTGVVSIPVLTSPSSAVRKLRAALNQSE